MSDRVVIVGAGRTPIAKFLGSFSDLSAPELGTRCVKALLDKSGVSAADVDEVIWGIGRQAGSGPNPARQVLVGAGVPQDRTAYTVNMACGSGLLSIIQAAESIERGDADVVVAGGSEAMSRMPYYLEGARTGLRLGHGELVDSMYKDGFQCPMADQLMGATAENLVEEFSISRDEQDEYAVRSQSRCESARKAGKFTDEILPVTIEARKGSVTIESDEHPRDGVNVASMQKLKPVFKKDGSVHPGNSSGITDGAAALIVCRESVAKSKGWNVLGFVGARARAGVEPSRMGVGPVPAVRRLLERNGRALADYELIELNEAFAAQVIACDRELQLDADKLNVNGGAIALGHPIGATGARIVVTLLHEMAKRDAKRGLATLCISGGLGLALDVDRA